MFLECSTPKPAFGPAAGWASALAAPEDGGEATGAPDTDMAEDWTDARDAADDVDMPGTTLNACCERIVNKKDIQNQLERTAKQGFRGLLLETAQCLTRQRNQSVSLLASLISCMLYSAVLPSQHIPEER
jgi:hypothetical protein